MDKAADIDACIVDRGKEKPAVLPTGPIFNQQRIPAMSPQQQRKRRRGIVIIPYVAGVSERL